MKALKLIALILTGAALLPACVGHKKMDDSEISRRLRVVETLLGKAQPRAALDSLRPLMDIELPSAADSALYSLCYAWAAKRNDILLPDDSIVSYATAYYSAPERVEEYAAEAMNAWYYRACIWFDNGLTLRAEEPVSQMFPLARKLQNHRFMANYYDIMGRIRQDQGQFEEAAEMFRLCAEESEAAGGHFSFNALLCHLMANADNLTPEKHYVMQDNINYLTEQLVRSTDEVNVSEWVGRLVDYYLVRDTPERSVRL